jgi:hypothetical protein
LDEIASTVAINCCYSANFLSMASGGSDLRVEWAAGREIFFHCPIAASMVDSPSGRHAFLHGADRSSFEGIAL